MSGYSILLNLELLKNTLEESYKEITNMNQDKGLNMILTLITISDESELQKIIPSLTVETVEVLCSNIKKIVIILLNSFD
jgi:hypothetical protein